MRKRTIEEALSHTLIPPLIELVTSYFDYDDVLLIKIPLYLYVDRYYMAGNMQRLYLLGEHNSILSIFRDGELIKERRLKIGIPRGMILHQQRLYISTQDDIRVFGLSRKHRPLLHRWKIPYPPHRDLYGIAVMARKGKVVVADTWYLHFFTTEGVYLERWELSEFTEDSYTRDVVISSREEIIVSSEAFLVVYNVEGKCLMKGEMLMRGISVSLRRETEIYCIIVSSMSGERDMLVLNIGETQVISLDNYVRTFSLYGAYPVHILCIEHDQTLVLDGRQCIHVFERDIREW